LLNKEKKECFISWESFSKKKFYQVEIQLEIGRTIRKSGLMWELSQERGIQADQEGN